MAEIYAGETPKFVIRLKDRNGSQLNPSDVFQVIELRAWIYNALTGTVIAKYYLNTPPSSNGNWVQATVKEIAPGDRGILIALTNAQTIAAPSNNNELQIEVTIPDSHLLNGQRILIGKKRFGEIKPAKTS